MPDALPVSSFSTDAIPLAQRHEAWRNRGWPTIGPIFDTAPTGAFFNRSDRFLLGDLVVHVSEMGGQTYQRDRALIRDDLDHVIISIPVSGRMQGDFDGLDASNGPGALVAIDLARPHRHISTDSRTIMLTVPRSRLPAMGIRAEALHGRVAAGHRVELLRSHVQAIHRHAGEISAHDGSALGESVLGLLRLALSRPDDAPVPAREGNEAALLLQAGHVIATNLGAPRLDAAMLCSLLGVSRSALYRAFEPHGGVAAFIRRQRLEQAAEDLRLGGNGLTIAAIGERAGFADPAHFSRAFRLHFGASPSDWRAGAGRPLRDG